MRLSDGMVAISLMVKYGMLQYGMVSLSLLYLVVAIPTHATSHYAAPASSPTIWTFNQHGTGILCGHGVSTKVVTLRL